MKIALFLLLSGLLTQMSTAQLKNQITVDEKTSKRMLIGLCDRNAFHDTSFVSWFNDEYEKYAVDTSTINLIAEEIQVLKMKIVLGTWCSDSREQIPRLFKILDHIKYSENNIQMFCVDRKKKAGEYDVDDLRIELVPTIIIYKDSEEIGRIIETPKMSLEEDMVDIIFSAK